MESGGSENPSSSLYPPVLIAEMIPSVHAASYNRSVTDAIVIFLHVFAAAIFIGPQVFMVAVAMPALRSLGDTDARQQASRAITRGFGMLAGVALVVLLATGIWNYYDAKDAGLIEQDDFPRYYTTLMVKLTLVTIVIVLTALHGAVFGPRLQRLQARGAGDAEIARARTFSMVASIATLAVSIGILVCAALMDANWSKL